MTASRNITSWQTEGEKEEAVTDFLFLDSKTLRVVTVVVKLKDAHALKEKL